MKNLPYRPHSLLTWLAGGAAVPPARTAASHSVALARRLAQAAPPVRSRSRRDLEGTRSNLG